PEVLAGAGATPRSDVYSAGIVLREMLTGPRADRPSARGAMPETLGAIIERATKLEPAERYADGAALAADLEQVAGRIGTAPLGDSPPIAVPVASSVTQTLELTPRRRTRPAASRRPRRPLLVLVLSLLLLLGAVAAVAMVTAGGLPSRAPAHATVTTHAPV